jgi:hypothetical protein
VNFLGLAGPLWCGDIGGGQLRIAGHLVNAVPRAFHWSGTEGDRPGPGDDPATDGNHGSGGMEPDMAVGMLLHTNAPLGAPILRGLPVTCLSHAIHCRRHMQYIIDACVGCAVVPGCSPNGSKCTAQGTFQEMPSEPWFPSVAGPSPVCRRSVAGHWTDSLIVLG